MNRNLEEQMRRQAERARYISSLSGGPEKWIGQVVKKGFTQASDETLDREWMWVQVTGTEGSRLVGRLLNHPMYASYLKWGDLVTFTEDEIYSADPDAEPFASNPEQN